MADEALKARIMDILEAGKTVTTAALMDETGLSRRDLQKAIHALRLDGVVICSRTTEGGGYWIPATPEQAQQYVDSMTRRGKAVFAAVSAARRFVKQQAKEDDR